MRLKKDLSFFSRAALTLLLMLISSGAFAQTVWWLSLNPNYGDESIDLYPSTYDWEKGICTCGIPSTYHRPGYTLKGWSTSPSGGVEYQSGQTITMTSDLTLYAQWELGEVIDALKYKVTSEIFPRTMELMGYSGDQPTGSLTIPASIQSGNDTYSVTTIGQDAFRSCSGLTSITIPAGVTSIGQDAFRSCSGLTSVIFASGSQLTTIGQGAFYQTGLTSITIPASVTSISQDAFLFCSSLTLVNFEAGSQLTTIGQDAFSYCSSLTTVNFASGSQLTTIGEGAFYKTGLTSITIPASVTTIGQDAFNACSSLASVNFASGSQLTTIGQGAFRQTGLTSIIIPASVTIIGQEAFYNTGLTSITIPASVTTIEDNPFALCSNMTNIMVYGSNTNFKDIDGVLYSKDGKEIVSYPIGKTGTSYTIPDGVTTIGPSAFQGSSLTSVTFPASITAIGIGAFLACSGLTFVTLYSNPSIGTNAFNNTAVTMNLTANNVGSDYWMTFYNDAYNLKADANTTVYKAKINGSSLALMEVTDKIVNSSTAVILKSSGNPVMTRVLGNSSDTHDNDLKGTMTETTTPSNCYTLAAKSGVVGFYKYEGSTIAAGKAYLIYTGSGARTFYSFSDDATAIEAPEVVGDSDDGDIYDLMGRKMQGQPTTKGIYVKQGKKYIVK